MVTFAVRRAASRILIWCATRESLSRNTALPAAQLTLRWYIEPPAFARVSSGIDAVQRSGRGRQRGGGAILGDPCSCPFDGTCRSCVGVPGPTLLLDLEKEVPNQRLQPQLVLRCLACACACACACALERSGHVSEPRSRLDMHARAVMLDSLAA